jgi:hypothetical protein
LGVADGGSAVLDGAMPFPFYSSIQITDVDVYPGSNGYAITVLLEPGTLSDGNVSGAVSLGLWWGSTVYGGPTMDSMYVSLSSAGTIAAWTGEVTLTSPYTVELNVNGTGMVATVAGQSLSVLWANILPVPVVTSVYGYMLQDFGST